MRFRLLWLTNPDAGIAGSEFPRNSLRPTQPEGESIVIWQDWIEHATASPRRGYGDRSDRDPGNMDHDRSRGRPRVPQALLAGSDWVFGLDLPAVLVIAGIGESRADRHGAKKGGASRKGMIGAPGLGASPIPLVGSLIGALRDAPAERSSANSTTRTPPRHHQARGCGDRPGTRDPASCAITVWVVLSVAAFAPWF